jgi:ankyrin repeat protein
LETRSQLGWPPVLFAARYGHKDILEFLHKKGANLEFERGYNALHVACYGADPETIKYLFEVGKVNPNPET